MAQQDHRMALPQGTRVQDFEFHRVLGHGGFGITYLGWNVTLDIAVAIKEYLPADLAVREQDLSVAPRSSGDEEDFQWGLDRFLEEARVMARFKHNNIIQVQHFFQAHGTAYIVMEYAEGETLAELLKRRGTLAEAELQAILLPLLSGLAAVHEAGILHRDIKPGNIMLRATDGSPVLVDFGAARQAVGARSRSMTAIVTPGYAPIEQYSSRGRQGPWTDMYALGGVCYRALTGELPAEATDRVRSDPLISITEAGRDKAGEAFLRAVDWALRVDEGDRPQEVGEWRAALLGEKAVPAVPTQAEDETGRSSSARSGLFRWSLALGVALLLGAGAWWGWQVYGGGGNLLTVMKSVLPTLEEPTPGTLLGAQTETPAETGTKTLAGAGTETRAEADEKVTGAEEAPPQDTVETEAAQSASVEAESKPAPAPPVEEDEVTRLLAAADADLKARRLTSPAGNNAWDRYQRVLELAPAHPEAMAGMERVIESYMALFGPALEQEEFDKASDYLERIRGLHPDSPVLEEGERRLKGAKQAQAKRLAENQAIREHLDSFEAALDREDFDGAAGSLERIRALRADAPELAEGERRLEEARQAQSERLAELARQRQAEAEREAELFEGALGEGDFDRAVGHLERMRELRPEAPAVLMEAEQRLVEAQQAEIERQRQEAEEKMRQYAGEMVDIPGGNFRMGDLSGDGVWKKMALPVHSVTVATFKMGKYEVTVGQFRRFVEATGYRTDAERNADGDEGCLELGKQLWRVSGKSWLNPRFSVGDDHPVVCVSWNDAQEFIDWLNSHADGDYRLPTEAEWEYAARAGSTTKYHFGNDESQLCQYGNHADNSADLKSRNTNCSDGVGNQATRVGQYQPNALGLYDMHGNVSEWVQDCDNRSYVGAPSDGRAWTSGNCSWRIGRGGSWSSTPAHLRSAARPSGPRSYRDNAWGFRLAQDE